MNFIKKIFDGKIDESVHLQFQKYSRGEFNNKAAVKVIHSKENYSISTTYEFASDLIKIMAKKLGNGKTKVTGVVVSTNDLTGQLNFTGKKQFMGVKQYVIDSEMSGNEMIGIIEKFPNAFVGLSFKVGEDELKIKPKAPKSAKPSTKTDEKPNPDFCKLKTQDSAIAKSFVFEVPDFKRADITHHFEIKEIIPPKDEKDFAKIRELAKRKGILMRDAMIDEKTYKKEVEFAA
jgi:hypothetical protein